MDVIVFLYEIEEISFESKILSSEMNNGKCDLKRRKRKNIITMNDIIKYFLCVTIDDVSELL